MKTKFYLYSVFLLGTLVNASTALAASFIDTNAPVVKLRDPANGGCMEAGVELNNCFTVLNTLNSWITNTRKPKSATPLLVDIGPGKYLGKFSCNKANYAGYVTLHGAGIKNTVIESARPVETTECEQMHFSHMTLRETLKGVKTLGGSTYWDNIEIDGTSYYLAWYDEFPSACPVTPGVHYWFNSKVATTSKMPGAVAYYNKCDVSWFFGSEITANGIYPDDPDSGEQGTTSVTPIKAEGGEVHVYGSVIRALSAPNVTTPITAIISTGTAQVHIHGTGIDVISAEANDITALASFNGGKIHADSAAFNLKTGVGGTITRITGEGHDVHAPYLWAAHSTPPNIISQDGADTAVVTTEGGTPRFVVYSKACSSNWFDVGCNDCVGSNACQQP